MHHEELVMAKIKPEHKMWMNFFFVKFSCYFGLEHDEALKLIRLMNRV